MRLAIFALALLAASGAAASPPGGHSGNGDKGGWNREHRPDRWDFGRHDWGFVRPCPGLASLGSCRRPFDRDFYAWPYPIVLPPTGNRYLPDDWPYYGMGYDPALVNPVPPYPAGWRAPFALPGLGTCPDGVQRCHEDEWTVADEAPR